MRIAVIGAGAMGSVFGARLLSPGVEVILFDINEAHVQAIRARGLTLGDAAGERLVTIAATARIAEVADADLALVLVDSNATARRRAAPAGRADEGRRRADTAERHRQRGSARGRAGRASGDRRLDLQQRRVHRARPCAPHQRRADRDRPARRSADRARPTRWPRSCRPPAFRPPPATTRWDMCGRSSS